MHSSFILSAVIIIPEKNEVTQPNVEEIFANSFEPHNQTINAEFLKPTDNLK